MVFTRSEVDDEVKKENGVRKSVENHPFSAEIIIEEGNCDGKNDEVGYEEN